MKFIKKLNHSKELIIMSMSSVTISILDSILKGRVLASPKISLIMRGIALRPMIGLNSSIDMALILPCGMYLEGDMDRFIVSTMRRFHS